MRFAPVKVFVIFTRKPLQVQNAIYMRKTPFTGAKNTAPVNDFCTCKYLQVIYRCKTHLQVQDAKTHFLKKRPFTGASSKNAAWIGSTCKWRFAPVNSGQTILKRTLLFNDNFQPNQFDLLRPRHPSTYHPKKHPTPSKLTDSHYHAKLRRFRKTKSRVFCFRTN